MIDLIKGDRIRHKIHDREGVVTATPRAHSPAAQCKLDDNSTPCYYRLIDLERLTKRDDKPASVTPNRFEPAGGPVVASQLPPIAQVPSDIEVGQVDDRDYGGDLNLPKLVGLRNDLANRLAMIDDQILGLRIAVAIKQSLLPLTRMASPETRARIAAQAVKLQGDMNAALSEGTP